MNDEDIGYVFGATQLQTILTRKIQTTQRLHQKFDRKVAMRLLDESLTESVEWLSSAHNIHGRENPLRQTGEK